MRGAGRLEIIGLYLNLIPTYTNYTTFIFLGIKKRSNYFFDSQFAHSLHALPQAYCHVELFKILFVPTLAALCT